MSRFDRVLIAVTAALCAACYVDNSEAQTSPPAAVNAIVTGGSNGTYFPMAKDLARHAALGLEVRESKGSWENIFRLADEPGVSFAMVQSDVLGYFNNWIKLQAGHSAVSKSVASLQVMLPLHEEEIHVVVPRASKLKYLHELKGQRIFMGRPGSGPFITGHQVYRVMFGEDPNVVSAEDFKLGESKLEIEAALMQLVSSANGGKPSVDAVFLVGGQPYGAVQTLEKSKETAARYKFLVADATNSATQKLLRHYQAAKLDAQYYGELLRGSASADTLAVQAYLVTVALTDPNRRRFVEEFAGRYCTNFETMIADPASHKKWRSVTWKPGTSFPRLAEGWRSVPPAIVSRLTSCSRSGGGQVNPGGQAAKKKCSGIPHPTAKGECL